MASFNDFLPSLYTADRNTTPWAPKTALPDGSRAATSGSANPVLIGCYHVGKAEGSFESNLLGGLAANLWCLMHLLFDKV